MIENNNTPEAERNDKPVTTGEAKYQAPDVKTYTGSELEQVILTVNAATGQVFP